MHPEYVEPSRREIEGPAYQIWESTGNGLPLLDSFLKDSARTNPLDSGTTPCNHRVLTRQANNTLDRGNTPHGPQTLYNVERYSR